MDTEEAQRLLARSVAKRRQWRADAPEPKLTEDLVDDVEDTEDLGVRAEDDLVDFGFEPDKQQ